MIIREFWNEQAAFLESLGSTNGRADARLLLMRTLDCSYTQFIMNLEQPFPPEAEPTYIRMRDEYLSDRPLQYILGSQSFMGLDFAVDERVLIPRPETELLVQTVAETLGPDEDGLIADLGTGSGAIAVSLAVMLPKARITAVDISADALDVAGSNAARNGMSDRIDFRLGDLTDGLKPDCLYSAVVSNPPYVTSEEMESLAPNVRQEPELALFGGEDGLDFYRRLADAAPRFLRSGGLLAVEIGWKQGLAVRKLWEEAGLAEVTVLRDFAGHDRVVTGRKV